MPRGRPHSFDFDIDLSFVDVEDFLDTLEISYTVGHANATFLCPFHHEHKPSARMSVETTAWLCNGCGERGKNAISFLAKLRSISMSEAKRVIEERYRGSLIAALDDLESEVARNLAGAEVEVEERITPDPEWVNMFYAALFSPGVWPEGVPDAVRMAREYIEGRGFWPATLGEWAIGYDWYSDRVTIPVRDAGGALVGFKGRAWYDRHPKYLVLGDARDRPARYGFQTYRKSEVVFGLDRCDPAPREIIIVEGELNVLAMKQLGYRNVAAVAGAEFSDAQAKLIVERADSAVIFFDANCAGVEGTAKVSRALAPHMPVKAITDAPGDAAELDAKSVDELINSASPTLELIVRGLLPILS